MKNTEPEKIQSVQADDFDQLNPSIVQLSPQSSMKIGRTNHATLYIESESPVNYAQVMINQGTLRKGFLRKVLLILMLQLAISSVAIGVTFIENSGIREFLQNQRPLIWVSVGIFIATLLIFTCNRNAFKKVPYNYILLFISTCSVSYLLAVLAAYTASDIVLFAGTFTFAVVIAVALYARFTKTDLSRKGYLLSGLFSMIILVFIFCLVFRSKFMNIIYSGLVGLFYTFFLAYDIQRLLGMYETKYSLDEYISASFELYIDIIQIFLLILMTRKSSD